MRRPSPQALLTTLFAIVGLCVAVGLAVLTSSLTSQTVGLAGESPEAGQRLVAPATTTGTASRPPRGTRTTTTDGQTTTGGHEDESREDASGEPDEDD